MLDFTQISEPVFEVKMRDGKIVHILSPNGELMSKMQKLNTEIGIDEVYRIVTDIVNNNKYLIKYELEAIKKEPYSFIKLLIDEYTKFINGIQKDPN